MPPQEKLQPPADFLFYPEAQEIKSPKYEARPGANPALSGLTLVIAAGILERSSFLSKIFYKNAGFHKIKDLPCLDEVPATYHPLVLPLGDNSPMIPLTPSQLQPPNRGPASHHLTASDYHAAYKSGQITPLQVTQTLLALTSKYSPDKTIYQDAWVDSHGADHLALEAATASTQRYAAGKPLGILDGVPVGIKDDLSVKGYIDHDGMAYREGVPFFSAAEKSLWPVQALQDAGAIVIGKNAMHEVGGDTNGLNPRQGTPTNHFNNNYYPGGSSSGAGSALGVGIVPIALGTDAGGSIRFPALYNSVYGLKPTHHRTMEMRSTVCVAGPMAANVADLIIAYRIISQPDPYSSIQSRFAVSQPPTSGGDGKRYIGIDRAWWSASDQRILDVCDRAVEHFCSHGYTVVDVSIPYVDESQTAHAGITVVDFLEAARRRGTPSVPWRSLVGPANRLLLAVGQQTSAVDVAAFASVRTLAMRHLAWLFRRYPGLLILTPTAPMLGWETDPAAYDRHGLSDGDRTLLSMLYVFLANLTGLPAVTAPIGYVDAGDDENKSKDNRSRRRNGGGGKVPVGMMAMGEWGAEETLLAWAAEAETYLHEVNPGGRVRPEAWVDVLDMARKRGAKGDKSDAGGPSSVGV